MKPRWVWALQFVGVGWYIALCIVLGALGGVWLDRRLGTMPLFSLLGVLGGIVLGFYGLYRMLVPGLHQNNENNRKA
ncbi:MAG: AtpZ/AtpI family protein [Chloroflexi bacterium]|nr:AtpZ/AtpI family protein [Chloroflexota bacterium]